MKNLKLFLFTLVAVFAVGFAVNVNAEGNVAKIGETEYATLQAAINAVEDGQTVVLLQDVEENPTIDGKDFVLDLGENTLTVGGYGVDTYESTLVVINGTVTVDEGFGFYLNNGNTFTLDTTAKINGTGTGVMSDLYPANAEVDNTVVVNGEINVEGTAIVLDNASTLIVNEGAKVIGTDGILIADETTTVDDVKVELHKNASDVTVNGYVAGSNVGITINGNITSDEYPTITIGSKAEIVTDGFETVGLYLAGNGKTTIADGAKLSGTAGAVEIRAGELTVNGGTFTSTYDGEEVVVTKNGSGSTTVGAALAIAQHTTRLPISVTINGGTFNGVAAIYESNPQGNSAENIAKISVSVTGGTFNATSNQTVYSEDLTGFISGGNYNIIPDAKYIAEGFESLVKVNLTNAVVTGIVKKTYNGTAQGQDDLVVTVNDTELVKNVDYTVSYDKNINAGTAEMTIEGQGNYTGTIVKTFTIDKLDMSDFTVTGIEDKVFNGHQQVQTITVSKDDVVLTEDDYTVTYGGNVDAGTAGMLIEGQGNYTGTIQKTFTIAPLDLSDAVLTGIVAQTYNGKIQRQDKLVVTLVDKKLTKDVDYTVGYSNLTNAGTITMTIKGKGNYEGKIVKTFVRKKAKNTLTVKASNKTVYYSKVRSKAQVVKPITVSKKVGTLTYTKMSGSKYLTLNKTTGQVTVKKGTKKGKYAIKIKVYASGNSNYFSNYTIKTVYVTVK